MAAGQEEQRIKGFQPELAESDPENCFQITLFFDPLTCRIQFDDDEFVMKNESIVYAALSEAISQMEAARAAEAVAAGLTFGLKQIQEENEGAGE